jgi:tetratricopeptide (TPR) repeat protein
MPEAGMALVGREVWIFELAGTKLRAALKEKNMKRTLILGLGLLAVALMPAVAQTAAPTGKIHGQVTNPTGQPQGSGTISLSTDGGATLKFTFQIGSTGEYSGEATPGTYMVVYRAADTPAGKMVDSIRGVKIIAGQDTLQDVDMTRAEYIKSLTPEQQKQLEELKKANQEAMSANKVINALNADLRTVAQDVKEAEGARQAAAQELGAGATRDAIEAKATEIRNAKYNDVLALMTKDTQAKPDEPILWSHLGRAHLGLKQYEDAESAYKKALDLEATAKKPSPEVIGVSNAGLGEVYARQGKVPEANAAFAAAAKADPTKAAFHLRNEAIIFFQEKNGPAQVAAADEAIKVDPTQPLLFYIKGQGLIQNATLDAKGHIVLPDECIKAYQQYLKLAPTGAYAGEVKGILTQAGVK